jgi:hypothetical protein
MSDESNKRELFEEFASEHAKRARHLSEAEERALAWQLMTQMTETEWYRQLCTPAARMAHERELLKTLEATGSTDEAR